MHKKSIQRTNMRVSLHQRLIAFCKKKTSTSREESSGVNIMKEMICTLPNKNRSD